MSTTVLTHTDVLVASRHDNGAQVTTTYGDGTVTVTPSLTVQHSRTLQSARGHR
jgi:hypothetical protein